jgi:hypothetical protein
MGILKTFRVALATALVAIMWPSVRAADAKGLSEQELKAAALYQVIHFTRWPDGTFGSNEDPIVIGIYGEDPFGSLIDELVTGERVSGHPLQVVRCFTPEAAANCHLVFVAETDEHSGARLLHALRTRSVLTVGDSEAFCERGGIVGLTVKNNRIRIVVNLEVARRSNVSLSSKLLRLAEIVKK